MCSKAVNKNILCLYTFLFLSCGHALGVTSVYIPGIYLNIREAHTVTEPIIETIVADADSDIPFEDLPSQQWFLTLPAQPDGSSVIKGFPSYTRSPKLLKGALATIAVIVSSRIDGNEQVFLSLFFPKKTQVDGLLFTDLNNEILKSETPKNITAFYRRVNVAVTEDFADLVIKNGMSSPDQSRSGAETALFDLREEAEQASVAIAELEQAPYLASSRQLQSYKTYPVLLVRAKLEPESENYLSIQNVDELCAAHQGAAMLLSSSPSLADGIRSSVTTPSPSLMRTSRYQMVTGTSSPINIKRELYRRGIDSGVSSMQASPQPSSATSSIEGSLTLLKIIDSSRRDHGSPNLSQFYSEEYPCGGMSPFPSPTPNPKQLAARSISGRESPALYHNCRFMGSVTSPPTDSISRTRSEPHQHPLRMTSHLSGSSFGERYGMKTETGQRCEYERMAAVTLPRGNKTGGLLQIFPASPVYEKQRSDVLLSSMVDQPHYQQPPKPRLHSASSLPIVRNFTGGHVKKPQGLNNKKTNYSWFGHPPPPISSLTGLVNMYDTVSNENIPGKEKFSITTSFEKQAKKKLVEIPDSFFHSADIVSLSECTDPDGKCFPQYFSHIMEEYFTGKFRHGSSLDNVDVNFNKWLNGAIGVVRDDLDRAIGWKHPYMVDHFDQHMEFLSYFQSFNEYRDVLFDIFDWVFSHSEEVMLHVARLRDWNYSVNGMTLETNEWMKVVTQEGFRVVAAAESGDPVVLMYPHMPPRHSKRELTEKEIDEIHSFKRFKSRVTQLDSFACSKNTTYPAQILIQTKCNGTTRSHNEAIAVTYEKMLTYLNDIMPLMVVSDCMQSMAYFHNLLSRSAKMNNVILSRGGNSQYYEYDTIRNIQFILFTRLLVHRRDNSEKELVKKAVKAFMEHMRKNTWFPVDGGVGITLSDWFVLHKVDGLVRNEFLATGSIAWSHVFDTMRFHQNYQPLSAHEKIKVHMVKRVGGIGKIHLDSVKQIYQGSPPADVINREQLGRLLLAVERYDKKDLPHQKSDKTLYKAPKLFKQKQGKGNDGVVQELDEVVTLSDQLKYTRMYDYMTRK